MINFTVGISSDKIVEFINITIWFSDAKEAQRLRIELHQERLINKRLSMKLDEMESSLISFQKSNVILNSIDLNEQHHLPVVESKDPDPLKVTSAHSGNSNEELEIALRQSARRVQDLEDKLIVCHRQLKAKVTQTYC